MVKTIANLVVLAASSTALADDAVEFAKPPPGDPREATPPVVLHEPGRSCILPYLPEPVSHDREDVTTLLGFHIGFGQLPVAGRELQQTALGLSVERRLFGPLRVIGEYEHVWLGVRDDEPDRRIVMDGNAHRAQLGLRMTFLDSPPLGDQLRFYADLELGGGMMLGSEPSTGTVLQPHAFAGVRLGYTFLNLHPGTRASIAWEPEVLVRGIAVEGGYGALIAVGMTWGD